MSPTASLRCKREEATRREISAVVDLSFEAARHVTVDLRGLAETHSAEGARPISARGDPRLPSTSLGIPTASARASGTPQDHNVDAFFVTLKKSESDYSPTTMYRDYPISPTLFHWESQSTTSVASKLASAT